MNVKRFVAADMRRALELVKQEMGDDAIILSSKRIKSGVEILTSCDVPYEEARQASQQADSYSNYSSLKSNSSSAFSHGLSPASIDENQYANDNVALHSDDTLRWDKIIKPSSQDRGVASGKTHQQLSREIEIARKKMEAADQLPLYQQVELDNQRQQQQKLEQSRLEQQNLEQQNLEQQHLEQQHLEQRQLDLHKLEQLQFAQQQLELEQYRQEEKKFEQLRKEFESQAIAKTPEYPPQHYSTKITHSASATDGRIEPQVPTHISEELLEGGDTNTGKKIHTEPTLANNCAPFVSPTYAWTVSQDLSQFVSHPAINSHDKADVSAVENNSADFQLQELKDEISDMREMLHVQLERLGQTKEQERTTSSKPVSLSSAIKATISRRLTQMGLSENTLKDIVKNVKVRAGLSETWTDVLAQLAHKIPVVGNDILVEGGVYAFVGPSGSGKTSTLSKLATRYVLSKPRKKLSIIVLDPGGSKDSPLVRLGSILDVAVDCVSDRVSLTRAIADHCDDDLILIDTPSPAQCQPDNFSLFNTLQRLPQVSNLLVLPANAQGRLLASNIEEFNALRVEACILSKLDECLSIGEAISAVMQSNTSVAYFTRGQKIPEDIEVARGYQLVTKAVSLLKKDQSSRTAPVYRKKPIQTSQQSLTA